MEETQETPQKKSGGLLAAGLDAAVKAVCPIYGVSLGRLEDKSTWRIDFMEGATDEQKSKAAEVLASF